MQKVANKCYLPTNRLLLKMIRRYEGRFKVSFSVTGVVLEQFQKYCPEVMSTFDAQLKPAVPGLLPKQYYHSLSFFILETNFTSRSASI